MAKQRREHANESSTENAGRQRPAGQQSDPDNVVKKGGIARSDADIADVSRDTHGFPGREGGTGTTGGTSQPAGRRSHEAIEADEALTEALEEAKGRDEEREGEGK